MVWISQGFNEQFHKKKYFYSIGEQGGWLRGGYPLLKKSFMTPPNTQNDPHPLRNGFWPPTWIFSFLSGRRFFSRKKFKKKNLEKKFSPAHAGTGFGPKKPKSAIKKNSPAPLSHHLKNFFMTPPP